MKIKKLSEGRQSWTDKKMNTLGKRGKPVYFTAAQLKDAQAKYPEYDFEETTIEYSLPKGQKAYIAKKKEDDNKLAEGSKGKGSGWYQLGNYVVIYSKEKDGWFVKDSRTDEFVHGKFSTDEEANEYINSLEESKSIKTFGAKAKKLDEAEVQYGVHQFSTDSIIFRGTEEECGKYIDKNKKLWDDAEVYRMEPGDPHYKRMEESIEVATIGDYITDHYEFDDIDDKYDCINSIRRSFADLGEDTISYEVLNQFIGAHNGRDKIEESVDTVTRYKVEYYAGDNDERLETYIYADSKDDCESEMKQKCPNCTITAMIPETVPASYKANDLKEDKCQPRSKRYTTYFNRIKRAIEKGDEETLKRTKEAIMYAPARELKNSEASELMDMIKNRKITESVSGKYGEVKYEPRRDGMPGESAVYANYHLFSNDGKYTPYWAGERPMGSSYNSVEDAVKGIDAFIDKQRKDGKMLHMKPVNEASYGGAFDIADDQYFTRDDLMSFADEVLGHVSETFNGLYDIGGVWFEDGNVITQIIDDSGNEYEDTTKVDMRKIRTPDHLRKMYAFPVAAKIIQLIKESSLDESLKLDEDVTEEAYRVRRYLDVEISEICRDVESHIDNMTEPALKKVSEHCRRFYAAMEDILYYLSADESLTESEDATKNVAVAFDVTVPVKMSEDAIEHELRRSLEGTDLEISSYVEVHTLNEGLTEDVETPVLRGPAEGPESGLATLLNEALQDELKTIQMYNDTAVTARAEGFDDIAAQIDEINTEENKHVGQLQELLKTISPNAQAIDAGELEAGDDLVAVSEGTNNSQQTGNNNPKGDVIIESKERWEEIYDSFKTIEKELKGDGEAITATVDRLYNDNIDDPDYKKAYDKWASNE